jgi:hypothetical protein
VPGCRGAPGDTYVNRPTVTGKGEPHSVTAVMGLTSSVGVAVPCKLSGRWRWWWTRRLVDHVSTDANA